MALRLPIRAQLLLLGLAVALPAALLFAWHAFETSRGVSEEAYARVGMLSRTTAAQLDTFLADYQALLGRVAEQPLVRSLDPKRCDPAIKELVRLHPEFVSLGVRDNTGAIICSYLPNPVPTLQEGRFDWFDDGLRTPGLAAGDAFRSPADGRWISVLTHPVRGENAMVTGLMCLPVDLLRLQERLFRSTPPGAIVVVADRRGQVLMRSHDPAAWIGKPLPTAFLEATRAPAGGVVDTTGDDGVRRLYAVATISRAGWHVMAGLPEEEAFAGYRQERNKLVAIGLAMLVAALALAWWSGSTIAKPILALAGTASLVASGNTSARAAVAGPTELEEVARQFNRMLDVRDRQREERTALVGHFGQLARLARDIILLIDPDGRIVEANDAAVAAYGYAPDELPGMDINVLCMAGSKAEAECRWNDAARPQGVRFETVHRRRNGTTFPVEVSANVIAIEGRLYHQSFIRDISDRRAAEAQVRRLTAAYATLSETNQAIVRTEDEAEMLRRVCRISVEFGGYLGAWIGFVDARTGDVVPAASHGHIAGLLGQLRLSIDPKRPEGRGPTGIALRAGTPRYCEDVLSDPSTAPWQDLARQFGIRAHVALPLRRADAVVGVLELYSAERGAFDAQMRSLLEEMATDVSFALDNIDRKAALAEWAGRYEATIKASGQILLDRDLAKGAMTLGGDVERILGYREDELAGRLARWVEIIHPEDRALFTGEMDRVIRAQLPFHLQYRVRRKDESSLFVQDDGYFVRDASGTITRMIGFVADITERRLADDRIRSQLEELRRWHSAMLGREIRVVQLKREVNDALARAGQPARYESPRPGAGQDTHG